MVFDFHQIGGPLSSREDNFEELCSQLIVREHPGAQPVEGRGGDRGIDVYEGCSPTAPRVVWQAKFFCDTLRNPQKRQIRESLSRVADARSLMTWILCLPRNLNLSEQEWFHGLRAQHPHLRLRWWGETKLRERLATYPDIALEFFPALADQPPEQSLIVHALSAGTLGVDPDTRRSGRVVEFMLSNLSNNVLILERICLEVLRWWPFDVPPGIEARIMTFRYAVTVRPGFIGEYVVTQEGFKYAKGDVDRFEVVVDSPPGNEYDTRINFYASDLASQKRFTVHSREFRLRFHNPNSSRPRRLLIIE